MLKRAEKARVLVNKIPGNSSSYLRIATDTKNV